MKEWKKMKQDLDQSIGWIEDLNGFEKSNKLKELCEAIPNELYQLFEDDMDAVIFNTFNIKDYSSLKEDEKDGCKERFSISLSSLKSFFINKKKPKQKRIFNIFSLYLYGKPCFDVESTQLSNHLLLSKKDKIKLKQLSNTKWFIYYYHYEHNSQIEKIGRCILSIEDADNMLLMNIQEDRATDFTGNVMMSVTGHHLNFDFISTTLDKNLKITVHASSGNIPDFMIGVYTNTYSSMSMAAGSIVFERIKDLKQSHKPKSYPLNQIYEKNAELPHGIGLFLKDRTRNFIKTKSNIFSISDLDKWLVEKNKKGSIR